MHSTSTSHCETGGRGNPVFVGDSSLRFLQRQDIYKEPHNNNHMLTAKFVIPRLGRGIHKVLDARLRIAGKTDKQCCP